MITETEAKKKWCPFVGAHGDPQHGGGINRNPDRQRDFNCIASECMCWQMSEMAGTKFTMEREAAAKLVERYPDAYKITDNNDGSPLVWLERLQDIGFCGLAHRSAT